MPVSRGCWFKRDSFAIKILLELPLNKLFRVVAAHVFQCLIVLSLDKCVVFLEAIKRGISSLLEMDDRVPGLGVGEGNIILVML